MLVLDNLLRNACEATPAGGQVTLRLTNRGGIAVFTVSSTGAATASLAAAVISLAGMTFFMAMQLRRRVALI